MGSCVTKSSADQRRTTSTLSDKNGRSNIYKLNGNNQNGQDNSFELKDEQFNGSGIDKRIKKLNMAYQNKYDGEQSIEQTQYVSCFNEQNSQSDPITKIVLLEQACITLKHKMSQEKQKYQQKLQNQKQNKKFGSSHTDLNKFSQEASSRTINLSSNHITSHQSTHVSLEQSNGQSNKQVSNEEHCYATIIKLADFIQERSQNLWEDPNDNEIHDALSSIFWASKILELDSLIEFREAVSKHIKVVQNENLRRPKQVKYSNNNANTYMNQQQHS